MGIDTLLVWLGTWWREALFMLIVAEGRIRVFYLLENKAKKTKPISIVAPSMFAFSSQNALMDSQFYR